MFALPIGEEAPSKYSQGLSIGGSRGRGSYLT
jgi:hypothetical protein